MTHLDFGKDMRPAGRTPDRHYAERLEKRRWTTSAEASKQLA
jgi:hypothetical protein